MSATQGELITSLLIARNRAWNVAFHGGPIAIKGDSLPEAELPGGLRITILSPRSERLIALAPYWERIVREAGLVPGESPSPSFLPFAAGRQPEDVEETAGEGEEETSTSTSQTRPLIDDVEGLARQTGQLDRNIANGSSISMLIQFGGRTVLLGGDAFAPDLEESIRTLGMITKSTGRRLPVDAFVLPHNGSRGNMTIGLLDLLDCPTYLISTNGAFFRHPDPQTIAMIIQYGRPRSGEPVTLIFNYFSEFNSGWSSPELQARWNYRAIYPESGRTGIRVDLAKPI